jgi:hypothetical protein
MINPNEEREPGMETCATCGRWNPRWDMIDDYRGDYICRECIEANDYIVCFTCRTALDPEEHQIYRQGGEFRCGRCNAVVHGDNLDDCDIEERN